MKKYDYSLDAIKGFSCLLMILAHTPLEFSGAIRTFQSIGGFAPVLFFAVSGVTTIFQIERKDFISLFYFYLSFAILGFSYNAIWHPDLWKNLNSDVPQIIALGVLTIYLIEKYIKPNLFFYLLLTVVVFIIHFYTSNRIYDFPLKQFIFNEGGFAFFPWIFTFFTGVIAYRIRNSFNLLFAGISTLLLFIYYLINKGDQLIVKYDMSIGYFLLSLVIIFLSFYLFRKKQKYSPNNLLIFLGKNSFLFLFIHLFFINTFVWLHLFKVNYIIIWLLVTMLSLIGVKLLPRLNKYIESYFESKLLWVVLAFAIITVPLLISSTSLVMLIEIFLGILFSLNYKRLTSLTTIKIKINKASTAKALE
ncbi:acyltransferase family protein [Niallia sp. Man26]|uniref:acyltransferase family protein n=1 Tax=Niallia sp. Man26 TaxID=2912824 RepID=UPI001ED9DCE0|nr:acyltransferase family protein [Niallia sp. Man26]UPO88342.1 hypothetical protein L8T27_004015 [Niallia sp. Man26]